MRSPRSAAIVGVLAAACAGTVLTGPAYADTTARGSSGQSMTVSRSTGLSRSGATVTVSGTGYNVDKGIYVAFCVDNGAGKLPTPCGGGADTTGSLGASHWISSNPPSYGEGLAVPYGAGGSFQVQLRITPKIGDIDCTTTKCVVASRADHTRTSDRTQDVRIPITFAAAATATRTAGPTTKPPTATTAPASAVPTSAAPTTGAPTTAAPTGATPTTGAPAVTATDPTDLQVNRVSSANDTGGWWIWALVALGVGLVALVGLRLRRRRQTP